MSVRLRYKIDVAVSSTEAEDRDLGNGSYEVVNDYEGEGGSWKTNLASGVTDEQIVLPNIADAKFLMVRITPKDPNADPAQVDLKLNDVGNTAIPVVARANKEGHFLLSTTGLTALYASNGGSVDMSLTVFAAGD